MDAIPEGDYRSKRDKFPYLVVEHEVNYWVHVDVDRFTGQVVDKEIEVVNE